MNCLFCNIISGEVPANIQYQDAHVIAFADINPQAPVHTLIIPRQHIATLNDLTPSDLPIISQLTGAAQRLAKEFNINESGYRLIFNCNAGAGQTVFHIHLHLLGGRALHWPPG